MITCVIFWFCVLAMFHSYIFYPFLLKLFSNGKKENGIVYTTDDSALPHVFVVMSLHNEEKVILEKLESIFNTSYPLNKLHVFVGSDNSTDNTNGIVQRFAAERTQITFIESKERSGKSNMLNKLVSIINEGGVDKAKSVFVLTDANVMFVRETIYELVKHFKNESIAEVGALFRNKAGNNEGISFQEMSYIQLENSIKYMEGLNWGCMLGAFGGCYALRAENWITLPANHIVDDFYLSMNVLVKGKKAIMERKAICYEDVSSDAMNEFKRKSRTQAGNFQNLVLFWKQLFRFDAVSFCFFSHKVIRWFGPLFLIGSFVTNLFLLHNTFYQFLFLLQILLWLSPIIDALLNKINVNLTILRFASYFIMMNIALAKGFVVFVKGVETNIWNPTERNVGSTKP